MPDNVLVRDLGTAPVATKDIAGVHHQKVLLEVDDDLVTPANPVPVEWDDIAGAWDYEPGTLSGAGSISKVGRCVGLRLYAFVAGSVTINGGAVIVIREGAGLDVNPRGQLVDPVVAWVSGTVDVFIEVLT